MRHLNWVEVGLALGVGVAHKWVYPGVETWFKQYAWIGPLTLALLLLVVAGLFIGSLFVNSKEDKNVGGFAILAVGVGVLLQSLTLFAGLFNQTVPFNSDWPSMLAFSGVLLGISALVGRTVYVLSGERLSQLSVF